MICAVRPELVPRWCADRPQRPGLRRTLGFIPCLEPELARFARRQDGRPASAPEQAYKFEASPVSEVGGDAPAVAGVGACDASGTATAAGRGVELVSGPKRRQNVRGLEIRHA